MQPWKTLARSLVLQRGKWLTVEDHTIALPDGREITEWPWIITPDYVNIMVVTVEHKFLCFRQTKYAVPETSLAPIGGYLEPGEDPLVAAQRETLEETGYEAAEWVNLGSYAVDGNRGAGTAHLFLARGAQRVAAPNADERDLEEQQLVHLSRAELAAALAAGEFKVLAWSAVAALALLAVPDTD